MNLCVFIAHFWNKSNQRPVYRNSEMKRIAALANILRNFGEC
jgi:hypothetical protein